VIQKNLKFSLFIFFGAYVSSLNAVGNEVGFLNDTSCPKHFLQNGEFNSQKSITYFVGLSDQQLLQERKLFCSSPESWAIEARIAYNTVVNLMEFNINPIYSCPDCGLWYSCEDCHSRCASLTGK